MRNKKSPSSGFSEVIFYKSPKGNINVEVFLQEETLWLTQKKIADLFEVDVRTVNEHLKNIFKSGELVESSVIRKFRITADDGKKYQTFFYSLDAIISVGYRVNSEKATHFRVWATARLKEYIIKGFTMNDERLKDPDHYFGKDYFENAGKVSHEVALALAEEEFEEYKKETDKKYLSDFDKEVKKLSKP